MSKFCVKCGQKLPSEVISFFAINKTHEFEDGSYCKTCAKIKVEQARRNG